MGDDEIMPKGHGLCQSCPVMTHAYTICHDDSWYHLFLQMDRHGQLRDAKIEQAAHMANAHNKFLASLY